MSELADQREPEQGINQTYQAPQGTAYGGWQIVSLKNLLQCGL
jgi:hypothetical protein